MSCNDTECLDVNCELLCCIICGSHLENEKYAKYDVCSELCYEVLGEYE